MSDSLFDKRKEFSLTREEKFLLLRLAREAIEAGVSGKPLPKFDLTPLSQNLRDPGASFVTLTIEGDLRGCIGALESTLPLAEDVRIHAVAAAVEDYRFQPVSLEELPHLAIEISRLTPLKRIEFASPEDLLSNLHPGVHGVVLMDDYHRGTFLPQVWQKAPDPEIFLTMLCRKMGIPGDLWRIGKLTVFVYEVEEFHEEPQLLQH